MSTLVSGLGGLAESIGSIYLASEQISADRDVAEAQANATADFPVVESGRDNNGDTIVPRSLSVDSKAVMIALLGSVAVVAVVMAAKAGKK